MQREKNILKRAIFIFTLLIFAAPIFYEVSAKNTYPGPVDYHPQPFDVVRYEAELDFTKALSTRMSGRCKAVMALRGEPDTSDYIFHLAELEIDSVFYHGVKTDFIQHNAQNSARSYYSVSLNRENIPQEKIAHQDTAIVEVYYSGQMEKEVLEGPGYIWGGVHSQSGVMFALGVGFSAKYVSTTRHWLACYDHPSDKAEFYGRFIIPENFMCASNGGLIKNELENGYRITEWAHPYPAATYMLTFAVGPLEEISYDSETPVSIYAKPNEAETAEKYFSNVPEMAQFYSSLFGEYPFEKVGYVITSEGAMEHQTMISFPRSLMYNEYAQGDTLNLTTAHELAHSWFGGLVTPYDFRDAWLNEGFAVFCEFLWINHKLGKIEYLEELSATIEEYIGYYSGIEGVFPLYDFSREYPSTNYPYTIYKKGGLALDMLRQQIGEAAFNSGINRYLSENAYGNVTTEKFRMAMEHSAGKDLGAFFNQWVYGKGWPIIEYELDTIALHGGGESMDLAVTLSQVQPQEYGLYEMLPVEFVFFHSPGGFTNEVLHLNDSSAQFIIEGLPAYDSILINKGPTYFTLMEIYEKGIISGTEPARQGDNSIRAFPNPGAMQIKFEFAYISGPLLIKIYNLAGELEFEDNCQGGDEYLLDISAFRPGSYFFILERKNKFNLERVINNGKLIDSIKFQVAH